MGAYNVAASSVTATANEEASNKDSKADPPRDNKKKERTPDTGEEPAIVGGDESETADLNVQEMKSVNVDDDNRLTMDENESADGERQHEKHEESHKVESSTTPEVSKKRGEKRNTEEAAQAARERYLARKRMKQSVQ